MKGLRIYRQPTDKNWMAVFTGVTGSGEKVKEEEAYNIVASSKKEAEFEARQIWGLTEK